MRWRLQPYLDLPMSRAAASITYGRSLYLELDAFGLEPCGGVERREAARQCSWMLKGSGIGDCGQAPERRRSLGRPRGKSKRVGVWSGGLPHGLLRARAL